MISSWRNQDDVKGSGGGIIFSIIQHSLGRTEKHPEKLLYIQYLEQNLTAETT
jgi:hypothetical protein